LLSTAAIRTAEAWQPQFSKGRRSYDRQIKSHHVQGDHMDIVTHHGQGKLQQIIEVGSHRLTADASVEAGGEATGPEPHDLLAAALGACTALTVTMYARRKGYKLDDVNVQISHAQQDSSYVFNRRIHYVGELSSEERARLTDIANKCPVHKTLMGTIQIVTVEAVKAD
jgi:putative redox protein